MGGFPHSTGARQGKAPGGFPHSTGARQGGRFPTRHRRAAGGRIPHGTGARLRWRAPGPVRWADFPHSTGARLNSTAPAPTADGRISTQHRAGRFWADSHTAPAARGKVDFLYSTGARQGGRIPHDGRIPTRHRRAARWRISTRHRRPARWADSHIDMYVASGYLWIAQLSGSLVVWRSVPVTGRVRPLTRQTAPRPADGPPFPRAALHPVGTYGNCVAVSGIRALQLPC